MHTLTKLTLGLALPLALASWSASPAARAVVRVPAGGDLQKALDAAEPGDTILLAAGAAFVGNFVLPTKQGGGWITVRSDAPADSVPRPGLRVAPRHAAQLAVIRSPNSERALRTAPGARQWRLELLEFSAAAVPEATLVELGDGSSRQRSLELVPRDFEIDRCYFHGDPERGQKRGLAINSGSTTVTGSYFADFKLRGQDAQAIAGWNGPGPFVIENNYLEASGENFLLGGADPSIAGLIPSDVTFRRNHVARPESWRAEKWQVKNLFELKNARRVLVEENLFERNWSGAQSGYAILFTVRNTEGKAPWATIEDVTFRLNVVRHSGSAFSILGRDDDGDPSGVASRIRIDSNLVYDIDRHRWGGAGHFLLIGEGPEHVSVERNTIIHGGNLMSAHGGPAARPVPIKGLTFRNNLARHNDYGVHGGGRGVGRDSLDAYFPDALFVRNVLAGGDASRYPSDNFFPSVQDFEEAFLNFGAGDYRLKAESPFARAATDGGSLGAPPAVFKLLGPPRRH